jgi:transposase
MAGKPKRMGQIKQLILLQQQGHGIKAIARELGMSKNTVKTYLKKVTALGTKRRISCSSTILYWKPSSMQAHHRTNKTVTRKSNATWTTILKS